MKSNQYVIPNNNINNTLQEINDNIESIYNFINRYNRNRYQNLNTQTNHSINNNLNSNTNNGSYEQLLSLDDVKVGIEDITKISEDNMLTEDCECLICREEFNKGDFFKKLNKCSHSFCESCTKNWFLENKKCPVCLFEY